MNYKHCVKYSLHMPNSGEFSRAPALSKLTQAYAEQATHRVSQVLIHSFTNPVDQDTLMLVHVILHYTLAKYSSLYTIILWIYNIIYIIYFCLYQKPIFENSSLLFSSSTP
jgi:hypothetical protein